MQENRPHDVSTPQRKIIAGHSGNEVCRERPRTHRELGVLQSHQAVDHAIDDDQRKRVHAASKGQSGQNSSARLERHRQLDTAEEEQTSLTPACSAASAAPCAALSAQPLCSGRPSSPSPASDRPRISDSATKTSSVFAVRRSKHSWVLRLTVDWSMVGSVARNC
jgi:hypothetical protein